MTEKGKKSFKSNLKNLAKPLNNHWHCISLIWNEYEQKIEYDSGFDLSLLFQTLSWKFILLQPWVNKNENM